MKFRTSFVTNSSSSSFICSYCGEIESGWDLCLEDSGMFCCENGHYVCQYHAPKYKQSELEDRILLKDSAYDIPLDYCPLCRCEKISNEDLLKFVLLELSEQQNKTIEEVKKEFQGKMVEKFGSEEGDGFKKFLDLYKEKGGK